MDALSAEDPHWIDGYRLGPAKWLLHSWWAAWLCFFVGQLATSAASWYERDGLQSAADTAALSLAATFVGVAAAVLAAAAAHKITKAQAAPADAPRAPAQAWISGQVRAQAANS